MKNKKLQFTLIAFSTIFVFIVFSAVDKRSKSTPSNIVDQYFENIVEENTSIQNVLKAKQAFEVKLNVKNVALQDFLLHNNNYYQTASEQANLISDSAVKKETIAAIHTSKLKYESMSNTLKATYADLEKANKKANDLITQLKIVTTLPKIQNYQTEQKNDLEKTKELQQETNQIIKTLND